VLLIEIALEKLFTFDIMDPMELIKLIILTNVIYLNPLVILFFLEEKQIILEKISEEFKERETL
jgi:hypothetical protein